MTANKLTANIIKFLQIQGCQAERVNNIARKIGTDSQSIWQKAYQKEVEKAGGIYYIAKDFDSFYEWYNLNFK